MRGPLRALCVAAWLAGCSGDALPPVGDRLHLPTGALLHPSGRWLHVANSNLDRAHAASALVAIDLDALDEALAGEVPVVDDLVSGSDDEVDGPRCARAAARRELIVCDERRFIREGDSVRLPSGAGNIAADRPAGDDGPLRLLIPSSHTREITWIDVTARAGGGVRLDCGQAADGACDSVHTLGNLRSDPDNARLPAEPARLVVDPQGFRFAYLPHLLGGVLTLIALDGGVGPRIVDFQSDFYNPDKSTDAEFSGGFSVTTRACDPDNAHLESHECTRPFSYTTHRHWPGIATFSIAVGLDVVLPQGSSAVVGASPFDVTDRPFMGDLEFEDPASGDTLLLVHTTPPALTRVDTRVIDGQTVDEAVATTPLCNYPNLLEVYRPEGREWLALVSCFSDDAVAVVGLGSFTRVATVAVDDGPNELVVDAARERLYVVNTLASTISIVELDHLSPRYLEEIARLGLPDDE